MEAREFGEKLCEKTATHWAAAQLNDETSKIAVKYIGAGVSVGDITEEVIPETVDKKQVKRLVSQVELTQLPNPQKLLVKRLSIEPANSDERNRGRFERLLGEEPVRTYVPLLLGPWVMDCAHKESVHLGEKVTLHLLQRHYWWIGMADSIRWWIRRCYPCRARKSARSTIRWPLVSLPLPSCPGWMVSFAFFGTFAGNEEWQRLCVFDSRYCLVDMQKDTSYAMTKDEKTARSCASKIVDDYILGMGVSSHLFIRSRYRIYLPG